MGNPNGRAQKIFIPDSLGCTTVNCHLGQYILLPTSIFSLNVFTFSIQTQQEAWSTIITIIITIFHIFAISYNCHLPFQLNLEQLMAIIQPKMRNSIDRKGSGNSNIIKARKLYRTITDIYHFPCDSKLCGVKVSTAYSMNN